MKENLIRSGGTKPPIYLKGKYFNIKVDANAIAIGIGCSGCFSSPFSSDNNFIFWSDAARLELGSKKGKSIPFSSRQLSRLYLPQVLNLINNHLHE